MHEEPSATTLDSPEPRRIMLTGLTGPQHQSPTMMKVTPPLYEINAVEAKLLEHGASTRKGIARRWAEGLVKLSRDNQYGGKYSRSPDRIQVAALAGRKLLGETGWKWVRTNALVAIERSCGWENARGARYQIRSWVSQAPGLQEWEVRLRKPTDAEFASMGARRDARKGKQGGDQLMREAYALLESEAIDGVYRQDVSFPHVVEMGRRLGLNMPRELREFLYAGNTSFDIKAAIPSILCDLLQDRLTSYESLELCTLYRKFLDSPQYALAKQLGWKQAFLSIPFGQSMKKGMTNEAGETMPEPLASTYIELHRLWRGVAMEVYAYSQQYFVERLGEAAAERLRANIRFGGKSVVPWLLKARAIAIMLQDHERRLIEAAIDRAREMSIRPLASGRGDTTRAKPVGLVHDEVILEGDCTDPSIGEALADAAWDAVGIDVDFGAEVLGA